jgi:thiol-disulfide isomerase/thioredoxin
MKRILAAIGAMAAVTLSSGQGSAPKQAASGDVPVVKIGNKIGKLKFLDIRYVPRTLADLGTKKAYVLVFTNTSCPVAKRYLPVLQAMSREYRDKEVQFVAVNAAMEDSVVAMATQAVQFDVEFPFVKDMTGDVARALGVRRTPEAVILDGKHQLRYRGRVDDQYRVSGSRPEATRHDLKDALDAVLSNKEVAVAETEVDGCPITFSVARQPREVTFAEHVAPVLQKHCWQCHQEGGSAPFSLTGYAQASKRAAAVAEVVADGRMPPWFASHEFGPFVNRRGLSDEERTILVDWARSGAAQGDAKKIAPPPPPPKSKWLIGEPDLVLQTSIYDLPAAGDIPYKYAILSHTFDQDTWVQGVQILADNPPVMHHCNLFYISGQSFKEENFITGNVPGGDVTALDDGVGFLIPKGSRLGLQIHFVSTGKAEKCRVSVGLRYPRSPVQKQLRHMQITDNGFAIPPGATAHKVSAERLIDRDIVGVGLFAHMHLRGKDMTFTAHLPDGKDETLLIIANYSFSWQVPYRWSPGQKRFPKGTRMECTAHFDNSAFNVFNPDPKATVRYGQQTHEEMMFGFFFYVAAEEKLGIEVDPKTGAQKK